MMNDFQGLIGSNSKNNFMQTFEKHEGTVVINPRVN